MATLKALFGRVANSLPARAIRKFGADDGSSWAIVIAWNALTAIFPIALALAAIAGALLSLVGVGQGEVTKLVLSVIPNDLSAQRDALAGIETLQRHSGALAVVALLGFLWTASGLFGAMEQAFDRVYGCPRRPFLPQKLMALGMMLLFSVLAVVAVGTSALLPLLYSLPGVLPSLHSGPAGVAVQAAIGVVSGFVLYLALYLVVPNLRVGLRHAWPGALFAGVAFEVLSSGFPLYLSLNRGINQYGKSFAFLFVLLAFFYFLGLITMLGVELNAALWAGVPQPDGSTSRPADTGPARSGLGGPRRVLFGLLGAGIGRLSAAAARRRAVSRRNR